MARIKINTLPAGFKLENGKIEEDQTMKDGGYVTGDQFDYGLVTTPQGYYSNTNFNDNLDENVRYSLSSVPKDKANIEAEGGETVLTDLTNDGRFGLYDIKGPRHSKGGVPMFLPEQSFIYSDTDKMKFTKDEMAEFGIESKNKKTPASLSKKYDLNKYYASIEDQFADDIQVKSAELMLNKNMNDLSKLAFVQESKKKFEDGVPLASHPYLIQQGVDPIEFTAQVEQITREQAQMNAIAALPPEQQEQLMMLQQMMAQADQQEMQGQQPMEGEQPMEEVIEDTVVVDSMARDGKELPKAQFGLKDQFGLAKMFPSSNFGVNRSSNTMMNGIDMMPRNFGDIDFSESTNLDWDNDGIPNSMDIDPLGLRMGTPTVASSLRQGDPVFQGTASETEVKEKVIPKNPLKTDHPKYKEWDDKLKSGNYTITTIVRPDGKTEINLAQSRDSYTPAQARSVAKRIGTGSTSIYDERIAGQKRAVDEMSKSGYQYLSGIYSEGNRPLSQGSIYNNQIVDGVYNPDIKANKSSGVYAYGSAEIRSKEAVEDFKYRWGDIIEQIDGFSFDNDANDPQWLKFQRLAEETRKKEHLEQFGSMDNYVPYYSEDGISGSTFDGVEGLHTFNTPRLKKTTLDSDTVLIDGDPADRKDLDVVIPEEYQAPRAEWWRQDQNNLIALGLMDDNLYLPWAPDAERVKMDYVLDDWRNATNTNTMVANTMANALGAVGGPQAVANSQIQGQTLAANAQAINRVNTNNVGIMNQVAAMQPQLDMAVNQENAKRQMGVYDGTQKTLQGHDNFLNWKIGKNAELENAALTNKANTFNLNSIYDNYAVNPTSGGMIDFTNPNALKKVGPQPDYLKSFYDQVLDYQKQTGKPMPDALVKALYPGQMANNTRDMTNAQAEMQQKGAPISYPTSASKGKEIKRMVVPFYTGKMGY